MLSESRRRKLELLIRSLKSGDLKRAQAILRAGAAPRASGGSAPTEPGGFAPAAGGVSFPPGEPLPLELAVPGVEVGLRPWDIAGSRGAPRDATRCGPPFAGGKLWLVRRALAEISGDGEAIQREYVSILKGARQRFDELEASVGLCHVANGLPEGPLFLDIETCGLAGSVIFLVGLMSCRDGALVFEQLLARDYSEEPAMLAALAERLAEAAVLVTFNGKSFDVTMLRERGIFHNLDLGTIPPHLDLLHESRRVYRGKVPNCRLQTLEQCLCRRRRVGDIPGSAIPAAYHAFVSTGDARNLKAILHHNLLDLLTMGQLLCAILTGQMPDDLGSA